MRIFIISLFISLVLHLNGQSSESCQSINSKEECNNSPKCSWHSISKSCKLKPQKKVDSRFVPNKKKPIEEDEDGWELKK
jgi:hypothetical protein